MIFREAGLNLAGLHTLGPLNKVDDLMGTDGEVSVLDMPESPSQDVFHDWLLESYEETLDQLLEDGGYFLELAENPNRFDDLVPEIRRYLRETILDLPHHNRQLTATRTTDTGIWLSPREPEKHVLSSTGRISCPLHRNPTSPSQNRSY